MCRTRRRGPAHNPEHAVCSQCVGSSPQVYTATCNLDTPATPRGHLNSRHLVSPIASVVAHPRLPRPTDTSALPSTQTLTLAGTNLDAASQPIYNWAQQPAPTAFVDPVYALYSTVSSNGSCSASSTPGGAAITAMTVVATPTSRTSSVFVFTNASLTSGATYLICASVNGAPYTTTGSTLTVASPCALDPLVITLTGGQANQVVTLRGGGFHSLVTFPNAAFGVFTSSSCATSTKNSDIVVSYAYTSAQLVVLTFDTTAQSSAANNLSLCHTENSGSAFWQLVALTEVEVGE